MPAAPAGAERAQAEVRRQGEGPDGSSPFRGGRDRGAVGARVWRDLRRCPTTVRLVRETTLMKILEVHAWLVERLRSAGVASPESEGWQLIESASGSSRASLLMEPRKLTPREERLLAKWVSRREAREPLQLILEVAHFYGLELRLHSGVLIPRPETERLVELTLAELRPLAAPRILDVGTGSGAVALAIKNERPDSLVMATDNDPRSLEIAGDNARMLGLEIDFAESDLLGSEAVRRFAATADVLVSNPPYLPSSDEGTAEPEVRWDPAGALYAGEDGLMIYRRLLAQAATTCRTDAVLLIELDPRNVEQAAMEAGDWSSTEVHEDLAGRKRFLKLTR